jgi:hypothetical protein
VYNIFCKEKILPGRPRRSLDGNIKIILKKYGVRVWNGFIWLGIENSGGLLRTWRCTFGAHRTRGISSVAEQRLASQEGLSCM